MRANRNGNRARGDAAAGAGDWELFDLADEARSAAVALLRALDGDA